MIFFEGDLGVGKIILVCVLIWEFGYSGLVKSLMYLLVEVYVVLSLYLYYFDFYWFELFEEFFDVGFDEYFNKIVVCLVEWLECV